MQAFQVRELEYAVGALSDRPGRGRSLVTRGPVLRSSPRILGAEVVVKQPIAPFIDPHACLWACQRSSGAVMTSCALERVQSQSHQRELNYHSAFAEPTGHQGDLSLGDCYGMLG